MLVRVLAVRFTRAVLDVLHYELLYLQHLQHLAGIVNVLLLAKPRDHLLEGLLVQGDVLHLHHLSLLYFHHLQHSHVHVDSL